MSARSFQRVLKLTRTIAVLAGVATIQVAHLAEAIWYRPRRQAWSAFYLRCGFRRCAMPCGVSSPVVVRRREGEDSVIGNW